MIDAREVDDLRSSVITAQLELDGLKAQVAQVLMLALHPKLLMYKACSMCVIGA